MGKPCVIYCDESGNDGPNYLEASAPFYVIAGWVTPHEAIADAAGAIELLRQERCKGAAELKFKMFRKKPWVLCETMARLGQIGLVPIYVVAEKRYCVVGKIIETFLDPYYNNRLSMPFTYDLLAKQELANTLYERLGDNALREFAAAYREPTPEGLETALTTIAGECRKCVNPEVAELVKGSSARLAEIAAAEVEVVTTWGKAMGTINLPCLITFLMLVEDLARKGAFAPTRVVHDEQGPYQKEYHFVFSEHCATSDTPTIDRAIVPGMRVPYGAIRMIDKLEFQRSIDQPLIQAADLLAGSIAHLATTLIEGRELQNQEVDLGRFVLPPLLFRDLAIAVPVCSDKMLRRFGAAINKAYPNVGAEHPQLSQEGGLPFRWTSTVPTDGPLPLLPAKAAKARTEAEPDISFKIDLPLYGIASDRSDQLTLLLPPGRTYEECARSEHSVPLWTRKDLADAFLAEQEWTEPHHVVEFGPKKVPELVERLRGLSTWTDLVVFNLFEENAVPYPIIRLADEIEAIWNRWVRASCSGVMPTLVQRTTIDGHEIVSVLLSSGKYGAMRMPNGPMANGATREDAIAELLARL